jgi:single-strand DNA-binding protein
MYLNRVTLIGYVVRDADRRTARDGPQYVCFEVATKESWLDSNGTSQSRSEVHRCVAWGSQLIATAGSLKASAHVRVEGSLRSRDYQKDDVQNRVWEIRVTSVAAIERVIGAPEPDPGSEDVAPFPTPR